jgi:hypothetical protein
MEMEMAKLTGKEAAAAQVRAVYLQSHHSV